MTAHAAVAVRGVSKHYETPAGIVRALDGVSLEVMPGESLAITGPSGCGKSTLLGLVAALEAPTAGTVAIAGQELSGLTDGERARLRRNEIGLVFQSDNLLPFLTAGENVGLQLALQASPDGHSRCASLLAALGLAREANMLPDQLSGGQRQRVAVARALVHRPSLILADEPTGSLDAGNSQLIIDLLLAAQRETGAALVVVTHDAHVARGLDRVLSLRDGRMEDGDAR